MSFNSGVFLVFLPVVTLVHWLLPHRLRSYWLLAASYFFYMYANPALIVLLLVSTAVDYCCGRGIEANRDRKGVTKLLLMASLCVNLGLLFTFKYFDFFAGSVNRLCEALAVGYRVPELGLILPVGISFYTFQTMSYTIDVYRGDFHAEKDPVTFALYVSFFPQLVAGPIERPGDLLPQLKCERKPSEGDLAAGGRLLLVGFFQKCVVADFCGIFVNRAFAAPETAGSLAIFLAGVLFCVQMLCDFNGYSLIAMGSARLLGVRLSRNFDRPYLSQNYTEFFRRWHISLNRWFTQYVYIPLGGSRKGKARRALNTFIVFGLCGLWHGANWTYVLWGLYAAFFVALEGFLRKPGKQRNDHPLLVFLRRCGMFLLFTPSAILFRAPSISVAFTLLRRLVTAGGSVEASFQLLGIGGVELLELVTFIVTMGCLAKWEQPDIPAAESAFVEGRRLTTAVWLILTIAFCWLALLAAEEASGFAYFQF